MCSISIKDRIFEVKKNLPKQTTLLVVSKFHSPVEILEAYNAGIRDFGENHVQELLYKVDVLPKDIRWHFIGNLQRNKVKQLLPIVHMVHSVGSERLYGEIVKRATIMNICPDILIEVHISEEESKEGFQPNYLLDYLHQFMSKKEDQPYRRIRGLMGMASFTDDQDKIREEFKALKRLFDEAKELIFTDAPFFDTLSMGMSNDWKLAVQEGSSLVRIGSYILGDRNYGN